MSIRIFFLTFMTPFLFSSASGQTTIQGKVIDSLSRQPIAFANLTLENGRSGTTTEIEGNFLLTFPQGYNGLVYISHVSYQRIALPLSYFKTHKTIALQPASTLLREVAVTGKEEENPAFRIIRQAVANKKQNDPIHLKSYQYISYNKFLVTLSAPSAHDDSVIQKLKNRNDTVKLKKNQKELLSFDSTMRTMHIFLSESVTEKQVINPDKAKEKLLALQVSGYKSPIFTNVATDYQPFSFYSDNISLLGKDFINPVSRGTFNRYDFVLADTAYLGQDTVYIIQFKPQPNKFFNGMKGMLSICTDGFAIKNVIASSADTLALTTIRIQQNYEKVEGHWFPVQLNTDLDFRNYKFFGRYLIAQHRSFFKEIKINPPLKRSAFGDINVDLTLPKPQENKLTLEHYRNNLLDKKEARTYVLIDSVFQKYKLGFLDKFIEAVATQAVPIGPLELNLNQISRVNKYEQFRLGAGLYTSNRFSKWLRLGGYAGYGFRDQRWKYGGEMKFNFNLNKDFFLRLSYATDIYETGSSHLVHEGQLLGNESFRTWVSSQYDRIEQYKGELGYRLMPDVHATVFVSRSEITPTYNYTLQLNNESLTKFLIAETGFVVRYVHAENYMSLNGKKIFLGQQFPVLTFSFAQAAPLWGTQQFNYTRLDFTAKQRLKHRYGGKTNFFFATGMVNGIAPYGKLYNGRGASATSQYIENYFQTMGLYEFTASKYASVFLSHNFGNVLLNKKYSKPELVAYHNMGVGQLENQQAHTGPVIQSFDKGFVESGLGLNSLFRGKYVNVAYWSVGGAVFYRYGPYTFLKPVDNVFWRVTFGFGF